jgi:hypothetical protein
MTLIECNDDGSANGSMSYLNVTGQTPGTHFILGFGNIVMIILELSVCV